MKLKIFFVLLLCLPFISCDNNGGDAPDDHITDYPYLLLQTDDSKVFIPEKGSDPLVIFSVSRKPTDRLSSVAWYVNGIEISPNSAKQTLGRTFEGYDPIEIDYFEAIIEAKGDVNVMIVSEYESGTVYKPSIKYKNDGKY